MDCTNMTAHAFFFLLFERRCTSLSQLKKKVPTMKTFIASTDKYKVSPVFFWLGATLSSACVPARVRNSAPNVMHAAVDRTSTPGAFSTSKRASKRWEGWISQSVNMVHLRMHTARCTSMHWRCRGWKEKWPPPRGDWSSRCWRCGYLFRCLRGRRCNYDQKRLGLPDLRP